MALSAMFALSPDARASASPGGEAMMGREVTAMASSRIETGVVSVDFAPSGLPYAVLIPVDDGGPYPLCSFLHGGGGGHQNLIYSFAIFARWWSEGVAGPMGVGMASTRALRY